MGRITQECGAPLNAVRTLDSKLDFNASTEVAANKQEACLNDLRALKAKALQQAQQRLDALCVLVSPRDATPRSSPRSTTSDTSKHVQSLDASMKTGDATTSDISVRLQTLEEGAVQGIDKLCATMEARDAVLSDILARLKILEEGAVVREMTFQSDLVALKEQHVQELSELRRDFKKKQVEELLDIRKEQEKQEHQFEKLGSIVTELEQLFSCTKQNLQHEQLNADWQVKFNELQLWANRQVQCLETEYLAPFGTLLRQMQGSMSEHKRCHDILKQQVRNDVERFKHERDQLREEIAPLKIDISGLGQKLLSCIIRAEEYKEHQEKRLSHAESNVLQYFEDVHAFIQAVGCKEHLEERIFQAESKSNASNIEQCTLAHLALYDELASVSATDPTARSEIDCNPRLQALLLRARSREPATRSCS
jgi:hypothetical protein